tara:strand:+ start:90 stop:314 length:225 start_codon:yes stop_codon:yes gene_type:complete
MKNPPAQLGLSEIEIIKDILIEAQEKIEKHPNISSLYDVENVRFNAFYEIESGLYDIIEELKRQAKCETQANNK